MADFKNSTTKITVSAPGKVILHGEHSVVYGKLAIASSIGLWTKLNLEELDNNSCVTLNFESIDLLVDIPINDIGKLIGALPMLDDHVFNFEQPQNVAYDLLIKVLEKYLQDSPFSGLELSKKNALMAFLYLYFAMLHSSEIAGKRMNLKIDSTITIGAGMGSSASFAVCIAAAFLELLKNKHHQNPDRLTEEYQVLKNKDFQLGKFTNNEKQLISMWAFQAERVMHGNPSGIDNSVCTFGSVIKYRKGCLPEPITFQHSLHGFLIDTNVPKDTKAQVRKVADLNEKIPTVTQHILQAMEVISQNAIECLERLDKSISIQSKCEEYNLLNTLFDVNQDLLRTIGVSHLAIENICCILKKFELHGKITGAGGGGYVLCLVPEGFSEETLGNVEKELENDGYTCKLLTLGCDGVFVEC